MKQIDQSSKSYPKLLCPLKQAPELLYALGELNSILKNKLYISVIGTRKVSSYGRRIVLDLIPKLVQKNAVIVSGLAPGIDSLAHETALLAGGSTIGITGFGLNYLKSSFCSEISLKMINSGRGAVISPFKPSQKPEKWTFVERNKIIAAVSNILIVVEAPEKSGATYTVNDMLDLGREVYSVPGDIFNYNSVGTNRLIKEGALVLTSVDDISFDKYYS